MKRLFIMAFMTMAIAANAQQKMSVTIGSETRTATLADNGATAALSARLEQAPVTVTLNSSGGFEIWGSLGFQLPTSDEPVDAQPGDIVLYNGSNICLFYGSNSWSYTRLGTIDGLTENELRTFLHAGESNITVTLSLANATGIGQVKKEESAANAHSLTGRRTSATNQEIIIQNGKKIIR